MNGFPLFGLDNRQENKERGSCACVASVRQGKQAPELKKEPKWEVKGDLKLKRDLKGVLKREHACLEQHPTETKVLRWDFHNFGLHYIHTYQNNWIWNQNQREIWENAIFPFQIPKYCLILKVFDTFSLCSLRTKQFFGLVKKRRVRERYQLMTLGTKIL